jgi:acetolactate synthase I/II/III large subunit
VTESGATVRSGGQLLIDCLCTADPPLFSCVPGESFLPVLDALHDLQQNGPRAPRLIVTRHEAAAANLAEAAGKLTGRAAVCFVTRGPGATHAGIGLHTAYQDGTPMVLVVGQVARAHLGREAFQEMDYRLVFGSSAKSVVQVMDVDRIPEHVTRALHLAHSGRPGPVVLVMPEDVLTDTSTAVPTPFRPLPPPAAHQRDLDQLQARITAARHPVLIAGGPGWTQAVGEQVRAFAETAQVPVATAFRWQDSIDNRSPAFAGFLGLGCSPRLRQRIAEADLVVALAPRLDDPTTDGFALIDARDADSLVLVSPDAEELTRTTTAATLILAGVAQVAAHLAGTASAPDGERSQWYTDLRAEQVAFHRGPASRPEPDMTAIVAQLRSMLPDEAVVTNGAGNYTVWLQRYFEYRRFPTMLAPRNGAMGYGLPAGLAAAVLFPDRPVVVFAGDGCLLMSGSELATAVQHDLTLLVIVVNNGMLGTIRMHQERQYPGRVIATDLQNPDFAAYARSFGAHGCVVERTEQFGPAVREALARRGPSLIEIRTDPQQITPDLRLDPTPLTSP